jgi:hypothetical protein
LFQAPFANINPPYSIEANCVLIGACIPCMAPLIAQLFGTKSFGSTPQYSGGRRDGSGQGGSKSGGLITFGARRSKKKSLYDTELTTTMSGDAIVDEERKIGTGSLHSNGSIPNTAATGIQKKNEFSVQYEARPGAPRW